MSWNRHIFETMGTVASISFDAPESGPVIAGLHQTFEHLDSTFSLHKPDSELSRIAAGRLRLADASHEIREAYSAATVWRSATHGDFTPNRPDGVVDLSGIVKAMAMNRAGSGLIDAGVTEWCFNVGGDVLTSGGDEHAEPWTVGIVDPFDRGMLITSVQLAGPRTSCATSGRAERGDHIWTIGSGPTEFTQATVVANDIITADVLATAIIAGGPAALDRICSTCDIDAMTVDRRGNLRMTPGFGRVPVTP